MVKTPVTKRRDDAAPLVKSDEGGGGGGGSSSDERTAIDIVIGANGGAETPAAASGTPPRRKTPGSSPGMTMRSGRKKKRNNSAFANTAVGSGVATAGTAPLRKRAKKSHERGGGDETVGEAAAASLNGKVSDVLTTVCDDKKEDGDNDSQRSRRGSRPSEVEEMDVEDEDEGGKVAGGDGATLDITRTREAARDLAISMQGTESPAEGGDDTEPVSAAVAPPSCAAPSNGSGGSNSVVRLFTNALRLPSQHTPAPPVPLASALGATPMPPPGGRRLIFNTAEKVSGGRNKLLMQIRRGTPKQSRPTVENGNEEPSSAQRDHFQSVDSNSSAESSQLNLLGRIEVDLRLNGDSYWNDLVLYTKAWTFLLFTLVLVGSITHHMPSSGSWAGASVIKDYGVLNLRKEVTKWGEWYGVELAEEVIVQTAESGGRNIDDDEVEIEPNIITETVTVTDPQLLSAARTALRANHVNLHDTIRLQQNMNVLAEGVSILDSGLGAWRIFYPELDFDGTDRAEGKDENEGSVMPIGNMVKKMVLNDILSGDVVIFAKSYCTQCKAAEQLFRGLTEEVESAPERTNSKTFQTIVVELDKLPHGKEMESSLLEITGQKTMPNIFVRGRHVGSYIDTQGLAKSGKLEELMRVDTMHQIPFVPSSGPNMTSFNTKRTSLEKIDSVKSSIAEKHSSLIEWELALLEVEEQLDLLYQGKISTAKANEAINALSKVSMVHADASVLNAEGIFVPGEGCAGMDYPLLEPVVVAEVEEEAVIVDVEETVEVVGGIDVSALNFASDVPVRLEDAQSAHEGLVKLALSTAEGLVGSSGPSPQAERWVNQLITDELRDKEVGDKPPTIEELHGPIFDQEATPLAPNSVLKTYTATEALRDLDRLLEIEDADRTGKFDQASLVNGAHILRRGPFATSYSLYETLPLVNRILAYAGLRFYGHPPEVALLPATTMYSRGRCWSFPNEMSSKRARRRDASAGNSILGDFATLTVSLAQAVTVTEVVVEHLPPSLVTQPSTAINEFRVVGFEDGGAYGEPWELGEFNLLIGPTIQTFSIPTKLDGQDVPRMKAISIAIDSNNGGDYSCLYRMRVHGV